MPGKMPGLGLDQNDIHGSLLHLVRVQLEVLQRSAKVHDSFDKLLEANKKAHAQNMQMKQEALQTKEKFSAVPETERNEEARVELKKLEIRLPHLEQEEKQLLDMQRRIMETKTKLMDSLVDFQNMMSETQEFLMTLFV